MNKYFSIFFKTLLAFLLGLLINLIILQEDPWLKNLIEHKIESIFSSIIGCPCLFRINKISLFEGKIIFRSLYALDTDKKWEFFCPNLTIDFSLKSLFHNSMIDIDLTFYNVNIKSNYENYNLSISQPIKLIATAPFVLPCQLKHLSFKYLTLDIQEPPDKPKHKINTTISFSSIESFLGSSSIDTTMFCSHGLFKKDNLIYGQNISGYINFNIGLLANSYPEIDSRIIIDIPNINQEPQKCILFCNYKKGQGYAEVHSNDHLFVAKISNILNISDQVAMDIRVNSSLQKLAQLAQCEKTNIPLNGNCDLAGHLCFAKDKISYNVKLMGKDFSYDNLNLKTVEAIITGDEKNIQGTIDVLNPGQINISGAWKYNLLNDCIKTKLILNEPIEFASYKICQGVAHCKIELKNAIFQTDYSVHLTNQNNKFDLLSGKSLFDGNNIILQGKLNCMNYVINCSINPFRFKSFDLKDMQDQKLIELTVDNSNTIDAEIDYHLIKGLVQTILSYDLNGEGKVKINGIYDNNIFNGSLKFENSNIRIPYMYNLIKNIKLNFKLDCNIKNLILQDLIIDLYKGKIGSLESTLICDYLGKLIYMHIPLSYKNCLISWKKEFFSLFSGNLTINYDKNSQSLLKGTVMLDHAYLRGNLLSPKVQQDLFNATIKSLNSSESNINLDIQLITQNPLHVKTPFFQANAVLNVNIKGTLFNPEISGTIELLQGSFEFPYKPLYITKGKIYLTQDNLDSPTIELEAENKIKKYNISMTITGSLDQPKISFQAAPNLQEEQIITLLLSGSEEGSLYFLMPNLIMQNLETLFFGPVENSSKLQQYFKNILKPLKNIRLIASNDQKNQNNVVKGAIEVDLSDKLRAKVQNNLNFSEQVQLELEYNLSDDISIKAVKDEQGSIGGEVEMRWKF